MDTPPLHSNIPTDTTAQLLRALENGQFETLFDLLPPLQHPLKELGPDQFTPLHYACQHGRLDIIKRLVSELNYDLHQLGNTMPTPLQVAAASGHTAIVEYILKSGVDISLKGGVVGPLHLAVDNGHLETLRALVQSKVCRVPLPDQDGNTPLHHACAHGRLPIISYLCDEAKHPLSITNKRGESSLHIAAKHGHFPVLKYLIDDKRCDPAAKDSRIGSTPLHLAAKNGSLDIVKYLANEKMCNIESKTFSKNRKNIGVSSGKTPLHYACFGGHRAVVEYLVKEQTCNPRCTDDDGLTPFHLACQEGHLEVVQFFLDLNISEFNNLATEDDRTPLHFAALSGNTELVRLLTELANCNMSAVDSEGRSALHYAARNGCTGIAQTMVEENKCNINCVDQAGNTPTHLAAKYGHLEMFKYLVSHPQCNAGCAEDQGHTALHLAVYKGQAEVVAFILSKKLIPVTCRDKAGRTPLHLAAQAGNLEIVKQLANQPDCEPMCIDKGLKATPLHMAAGSGHLPVVRYLIEEKQVNPACTDKFNSTPVHRAAAIGHLDIIHYLVGERSCSCTARNKFGNSPLHLACQKGQLAMVRLLLSFSTENITLRNQVGRMPLDQVKDSEILGEFLQLGVDPSRSSVTSRFTYLKHWSVLSPAVKVFLLGDSAVGKTTLVKALQGEGFVTEWLSGRFHRNRTTGGETAGINVTIFESRHFGRVVLYDLSGNPSYFASHSAVLKLACCGSQPLFITMVNLRKTPEEIEDSVSYWSQLVALSLPSNPPKCLGILLGNHENDLTKEGAKHKPALLEKLAQSHSNVVQHKGSLAFDCRRVASNGMHKLRQLLSQLCNELRVNLKPSYECNLLYSFILHKFQHPMIMEFRELKDYISHSDIPCLKEQDRLQKSCELLHSRGYLLLVPDSVPSENSWIILNQDTVLSMIQGFQKQIELTNKAGLLAVSQLEHTLGAVGFNITLVIQYFLRMKFCLRVVDRRVLFSVVGFDPPSPPEDHLFFPHLVTGEIPPDVWLHSDSWGQHFGWVMECTGSNSFFTPRFAQMMILRIAAVFPFNTDPNSTYLTRRGMTHIWRHGLSWADTRGMEVVVTLELNSKAVIVLIRVRREASCEVEFYRLRSLVLREIRSIRLDVCPGASVQESVLLPETATQYPLLTSDHTLLACAMDDIVGALLSPGAHCVSCTHRLFASGESQQDKQDSLLPLNKIVDFESYAVFSDQFLKALFSRDIDSKLSESDFDQLQTDLNTSELSTTLLAQILRVTMTINTDLSRAETIAAMIRRWAGGHGLCVGEWRAVWDQFSLLSALPINTEVNASMMIDDRQPPLSLSKN